MNKDLILKGLRDPFYSYRYLISFLKGWYYKGKYKILNRNVKIGKGFSIIGKGKLDINGPGRVVIGDNVIITGHVTPWTVAKGAEIFIGEGTKLDGTKFGCRNKIEIGKHCLIGIECRIMDTDFHSIYPDKRDNPVYIKTAPVTIGDNVWITMRCVILKGVTIGSNSAVLPQSVVSRPLPEWGLCGGSPAALIKKIEKDD